MGRGYFDDRSRARAKIDRSRGGTRKEGSAILFAVSQARSVDRVISSSDVAARGFECRFANNIVCPVSLSESRLGLDYTRGHRNPEVPVQFAGNLGRH